MLPIHSPSFFHHKVWIPPKLLFKPLHPPVEYTSWHHKCLTMTRDFATKRCHKSGSMKKGSGNKQFSTGSNMTYLNKSMAIWRANSSLSPPSNDTGARFLTTSSLQRSLRSIQNFNAWLTFRVMHPVEQLVGVLLQGSWPKQFEKYRSASLE